MSRKIIIDTDPGQDDAIALLLAFASPELDVLGITTVAGNVSVEHTTANALRLRELANCEDIPVFAGCPRPLVRTPVTAEEVHGETGLNGCGLPPARGQVEPQHAVTWLIDTLRSAAEPITLCTLGPFTNIASALTQAPDIADNIAQIVAMAGAVTTHGNVTPAAEFNVFADPHAADIVLQAGCDMVWIPLDVTHQALTTPERLARFAALPDPIGPATHGMLSFYFHPNVARHGVEGSPLHDPCVIAYLLDESLLTGKFVNVRVETTSNLTFGMSLGDWWGRTDRPANCTVMQTIDADRFFEMIWERLPRLTTR